MLLSSHVQFDLITWLKRWKSFIRTRCTSKSITKIALSTTRLNLPSLKLFLPVFHSKTSVKMSKLTLLCRMYNSHMASPLSYNHQPLQMFYTPLNLINSSINHLNLSIDFSQDSSLRFGTKDFYPLPFSRSFLAIA